SSVAGQVGQYCRSGFPRRLVERVPLPRGRPAYSCTAAAIGTREDIGPTVHAAAWLAAPPGKATAAALTETARSRVILRPSYRSGVAMPRPARPRALLASWIAVGVAGCATTPATPPPAAASVVEGRIVSIDTQPWTYDGNAVIRIDSVDRGSVAVALP